MMPRSGGAFPCRLMAIYVPAMTVLPFPDPATERERDEARQNPDHEILELAAQGAAKVLGADHGVTMAFAKAAESMAPADLWLARIAIKTLRRDQREAIAEAAES